jgi:hypothetical protein
MATGEGGAGMQGNVESPSALRSALSEKAIMSAPHSQLFVAVNASRKRVIKWGGSMLSSNLNALLDDGAFQRVLVAQLATRWQEVRVCGFEQAVVFVAGSSRL